MDCTFKNHFGLYLDVLINNYAPSKIVLFSFNNNLIKIRIRVEPRETNKTLCGFSIAFFYRGHTDLWFFFHSAGKTTDRTICHCLLLSFSYIFRLFIRRILLLCLRVKVHFIFYTCIGFIYEFLFVFKHLKKRL